GTGTGQCQVLGYFGYWVESLGYVLGLMVKKHRDQRRSSRTDVSLSELVMVMGNRRRCGQ
ncbi:hypothetical protein KI387_007758, partial [Taxus chinensis]